MKYHNESFNGTLDFQSKFIVYFLIHLPHLCLFAKAPPAFKAGMWQSTHAVSEIILRCESSHISVHTSMP